MRRFSKTRLLPITLPIAAALTVQFPAAAFAYKCQPQFDKEIAQLAIPEERIKDAFSVNIYNRSGSKFQGVERWISFNDCKGNLVIKMDRICRPQGNYTTYECRVPGVRNY